MLFRTFSTRRFTYIAVFLVCLCACYSIWTDTDLSIRFNFTTQRNERNLRQSSIYSTPNHTNNVAVSNDVDFRVNFNEVWDKKNPNMGPEFVDDTNKFVIYRCVQVKVEKNCGGWGDRVKGMLLGYLMANLTGRVFKFDSVNPDCDITKFLVPNRVDWSLPKPFHREFNVTNLPAKTLFLNYHCRKKGYFEEVDFSKIIDRNIKFVYMKGNWDYMSEFQSNPVYARQLAWMKGLRKDQIFSELYRNLFRPSPTLKSRIQKTLKKHLPTPQHKLICAHIRMGTEAGPTFIAEPTRMSPEYLPKVWKFISDHSTTDLHKVFLMSDSDSTLQGAKRQSFWSRLITTPGPVYHLEKGRDKKDICDALEKIVFDQAILMNCDVLLISHSALGRMAAFVRGSDEGLYCLFLGGIIKKCRADQFSQLYGLRG